MNRDPAAELPDYNALAAVFDRFLPLVTPVTDAILEHLGPLPANARVLDVACGTGEPGLTLARRSPDVQLLGVDAAAGMLEVAKAKAAREQLANVRFEVMGAETLACADGSMDAVLSRFGLLMFGDVAASARELARVLRDCGRFSVAVWHDMNKNTLVDTVITALRPHFSADHFLAFDRLTETDVSARLTEAGFAEFDSAPFSWSYNFPSWEALWEFASGPGLFGPKFAAVGDTVKEQVRVKLMGDFGAYRQDDGSYLIPHTCRVWWGRR